MPDTLPPLPEHIERVLDAAHLAPSNDNLQPWRFVVEGETISFLVDHERDRSPANAAGRVARIAVGAALECVLLRAGRMGATVRILPERPGALVTMSVTAPKRDPEPDKGLIRRVTNRRIYDGRALDDATMTALQQATPPLESTRTLWYGRERVRTLGPLVADGESFFYRDSHARDAALQAIRFDVRDSEEVSRGLSVGSLELSSAERLIVDSFRRTPQSRLEAAGAFDKMGTHARRLVESASAVFIVVTTSSDAMSDVLVGRSMQRAWLALTRRGLVAQPMNAIPSIETRLGLDQSAAPPFVDADRARAVVANFRAAFPVVEKGARIAFLMRAGQAPPPTARVRRLPLGHSVVLGAAPPSIR